MRNAVLPFFLGLIVGESLFAGITLLWGLATGSIPLLSNAVGKRYFMPLTATYTMRMQSNFHRKWIMHP